MKKGIVMQIDDAYLTLLTPDGQFLQARNKHYPYELGEEVLFTPIAPSTREKSGLKRLFLKPLLLSAAVILLLIGSYLPIYNSSNKAYAYMSIDVNPSIELGINKQMQVVKLTPFNEDGKKLLSKIGDWRKKEVTKIAKSILEQMKEGGYLKKSHLVIISTVRTEEAEEKVEEQLTKNINEIKATVKENHLQLAVFTGTEKEMEKAHNLGMTTGTYKGTKIPLNRDQEKIQESEKLQDSGKNQEPKKIQLPLKAPTPGKSENKQKPLGTYVPDKKQVEKITDVHRRTAAVIRKQPKIKWHKPEKVKIHKQLTAHPAHPAHQNHTNAGAPQKFKKDDHPVKKDVSRTNGNAKDDRKDHPQPVSIKKHEETTKKSFHSNDHGQDKKQWGPNKNKQQKEVKNDHDSNHR